MIWSHGQRCRTVAAVNKAVSDAETRFTPLLVKIGLPVMCKTLFPGLLVNLPVSSL